MQFPFYCKPAFLFLFFLAAIPGYAQTTPEFIAKPYLQIGRRPSPSTLDILWQVVDNPADWKLEYKDWAASDWKAAPTPVATPLTQAGIQPRWLYRTSLSGLNPGASFQYRLSRAGKIVFSSQAQALKAPDQPYRFIISGDIGAATTDAKLLARQSFLSHPDMVIIPGDIIYENGRISEYDTKFWPIYNADSVSKEGAPLMRSIPYIGAPGNHDVDNRSLDQFPDGLAYFFLWQQPLNGPAGKEGDAFVPVMKASDSNRAAFLQAAGDAYPGMVNFSFNYGNAHCLVIDSDPYVDWTDKGLQEWVQKDLVNAANATWRFVFFHHPGFSSSREHYEQQQMRLLSPIFEATKVDIVFSGHVHNYQRSYPLTFVPDRIGTLMVGGRDNKAIRGRVVNGRWTLDKAFDGKTVTKPHGIIYIVTGAGGQELYNPEQNDDPDSWQKFTDKFISKVHSLSLVEINGTRFTFRQLGTEGQELDSFTINK